MLPNLASELILKLKPYNLRRSLRVKRRGTRRLNRRLLSQTRKSNLRLRSKVIKRNRRVASLIRLVKLSKRSQKVLKLKRKQKHRH
jgi:hypothetical protein